MRTDAEESAERQKKEKLYWAVSNILNREICTGDIRTSFPDR